LSRPLPHFGQTFEKVKYLGAVEAVYQFITRYTPGMLVHLKSIGRSAAYDESGLCFQCLWQFAHIAKIRLIDQQRTNQAKTKAKGGK